MTETQYLRLSLLVKPPLLWTFWHEVVNGALAVIEPTRQTDPDFAVGTVEETSIEAVVIALALC